MDSGRKNAVIERRTQEIKEDMLTDLDQSPKQVKNWFTSNIFHRALSYMVGFTTSGVAKKLQATESGVLKTANTGGGFEHVTVLTGTATTVESGAYNFNDPVSRLRIIAVDYDLLVRPSANGVNFEDQVYIKAGSDTTIDLICKSLKVQKAGTNDSVYRIEGYR